jgi:hypothetical protein
LLLFFNIFLQSLNKGSEYDVDLFLVHCVAKVFILTTGVTLFTVGGVLFVGLRLEMYLLNGGLVTGLQELVAFVGT